MLTCAGSTSESDTHESILVCPKKIVLRPSVSPLRIPYSALSPAVVLATFTSHTYVPHLEYHVARLCLVLSRSSRCYVPATVLSRFFLWQLDEDLFYKYPQFTRLVHSTHCLSCWTRRVYLKPDLVLQFLSSASRCHPHEYHGPFVHRARTWLPFWVRI